MKNRLIFKFIVMYAVILLAGFILMSTAGSQMIYRCILSYEGQKMTSEAVRIANDESLVAYHRTTDNSYLTSLQALYKNLKGLAAYQSGEIWLISTSGTVYLNTAAPLDTEDPEVIPDFNPIALGSDYYSVGTFFDCYDSDHLTVMVPVTSNLKIRGYVAIHKGMDDIYRFREQLLGIMHIFCLIAYALFLPVLIMVYFWVLRPVRRIIDGTRHYSNGDLDHQINVTSHDEMGDLASSLNYMATEMNKTGEYERNFIANISHDFRSPLTSIKGFVEAMLDGTIPPEMQEKYLRIVLGETERLTKLTNGILTLNGMDRKQFILNWSDFDINSVIRNTAAAFEGTCRPRQISIQLMLTGESLYVHADKERIQQVLYNLIDNAIKFSKDGSSIEIESDLRHEKIFVKVKDHGCGIPRSSLNKIWDRFYKTDVSRGRERKGNGLGLSIVREIINQHGQNITVISTEGVGSEFVFSLAAASQEEA